MAQFDVWRNPNPRTRTALPYLLELQADFLDDLSTTVVAPMAAHTTFVDATRLNPRFEIEGRQTILSTAEISAAPRQMLRDRVMNLQSDRDRIVAALDFLFTGV